MVPYARSLILFVFPVMAVPVTTTSTMNLIHYPTKGFSSSCQRLINKGQAVRILVANGWRERQIRRLLSLFEEDNVIAETDHSDKGGAVLRKSSLAYILSMVLLPNFFYVHTYALAHGYHFSASVQDGALYINYKSKLAR